MSNFTFLEKNEILGSNGVSQLDIFKTIGTKAAITDFSIILGGYVSSFHTDNSTFLDTRTGYWWTRTDDGDNDARFVN